MAVCPFIVLALYKSQSFLHVLLHNSLLRWSKVTGKTHCLLKLAEDPFLSYIFCRFWHLINHVPALPTLLWINQNPHLDHSSPFCRCQMDLLSTTVFPGRARQQDRMHWSMTGLTAYSPFLPLALKHKHCATFSHDIIESCLYHLFSFFLNQISFNYPIRQSDLAPSPWLCQHLYKKKE